MRSHIKTREGERDRPSVDFGACRFRLPCLKNLRLIRLINGVRCEDIVVDYCWPTKCSHNWGEQIMANRQTITKQVLPQRGMWKAFHFFLYCNSNQCRSLHYPQELPVLPFLFGYHSCTHPLIHRHPQYSTFHENMVTDIHKFHNWRHQSLRRIIRRLSLTCDLQTFNPLSLASFHRSREWLGSKTSGLSVEQPIGNPRHRSPREISFELA